MSYASNMAAANKLRAAAKLVGGLPKMMGEFYANGGAGVANPVVGDRFMGAGNSRFAPLSRDYAITKAGQSKGLNTAQHQTYGRGSKLITSSTQGFLGKSLPILVRTGKLRAMVAYSRGHRITQNGDVARVTFTNLPFYAKYHHTGTSKMPKRSPVEPNAADIVRVKEFAERRLSAYINAGSSVTAFGGGIARII